MKNVESNENRNDSFFHPSEITARSTLQIPFSNKSSVSSGSSKVDSGAYSKGIDDILATSYSEEVRKINRESLDRNSLPRVSYLICFFSSFAL